MKYSAIAKVRSFFLVSCATTTLFYSVGCSSVHIRANQAPKADDVHKKTVVALWWGVSDPLESIECNGNGLQVVSTSTSWLYAACTFLTLGAVAPMDIEYRCTSAPLQQGGTLGE